MGVSVCHQAEQLNSKIKKAPYLRPWSVVGRPYRSWNDKPYRSKGRS